MIYLSAERWLCLIKFPRHMYILCSLPREHKHDRPFALFMGPGKHLLGIAYLQCMYSILVIPADQYPSMSECSSAHLECVGYIWQRSLRVPLQVPGQSSGCTLECCACFRREHK